MCHADQGKLSELYARGQGVKCMGETIIKGINTITGITSKNGKLKLGNGIWD